MVNRRKGGCRVVLVWLLLCAMLCVCACAEDYEVEEDGSIWYADGRVQLPDGTVIQAENADDPNAPVSQETTDGGMVIDTGEEDPLAGIERNEDGSITIESGQGGVDIEIEPTRAPLTPEEWAELNAKADLRNGTYTPTVYRDPATGLMTEVEVRYMGIGRSMIVLDGQETLVNTVDLTWQTEAPADKVLAVVNTPKNGYANLWSKASSNRKKSAILEQVRLDQVLRVINTGKNWTFVDHNGKRGYIKTGSLEFYANDHATFQTGLVSVKGKTKGRDTVNIRSRDKTHRVLTDNGGYMQGTPVTVFDIMDDWAEIDICGWHCMINKKFVTLETEAMAGLAAAAAD